MHPVNNKLVHNIIMVVFMSIHFSSLVKHLEEATTYYFQVSALSTNDYQATSDRVTLVVPAYKRVRAISMGIMGAVALLGIAFGVFYYTRKRCFDKKNKPHLTKDSSLS